MLNYFLQFKTNDIEHKYNQDHIHENLAIRKRAFFLIIIFCTIESTTKLIIQLAFHGYEINAQNTSAIIHFAGGISTLIPLGFIGFASKMCSFKRKFMQDMLCILFLGAEVMFELPSFRFGTRYPELPWITRLECLLSGLKCLWRVILGLKIMWFLKSKVLLIIAVLTLELLHLRLACMENTELDDNSQNYVFFVLVTIEYIYIITILYNEEKSLRIGFLQKYREIESNNTLKFILNQIPENIVIIDHDLQPKFISNSLFNDLNEKTQSTLTMQDIFDHIIDLKERNDNIMTMNTHHQSKQKESKQIEEQLAIQIRDNQLIERTNSNIKKKDIGEENSKKKVNNNDPYNSNDDSNTSIFPYDLTLLDLIKGNKCKFTLFDYIKEKNSKPKPNPIYLDTLDNNQKSQHNHHDPNGINNPNSHIGILHCLRTTTNSSRNNTEESIKQSTLIFDCKYHLEQANIKKSVELKISLAYFDNKECLILIFKDTTIRDIIARLEDDNLYKEKLLASVTHELRTPLNGNLAMIECAIDDKAVPMNIKEKFLIPAFNSGKFLMNIINDILDFSQMNVNSLRLVYTPNNIRDTIKNCCNLINIQAQKKGVKIIVDIDNNVPKMFNTDHNRLTQIILNLLSNSLKFTYQGYIKIKAIIKGDYLSISVEDTGLGIKKEHLKELFKPFTKLNLGDKAKMNCVGVGLGLSISNTLAKCLGPSKDYRGLVVESIYEVGTKFEFLLEEKKEFSSMSQHPCSSSPIHSHQQEQHQKHQQEHHEEQTHPSNPQQQTVAPSDNYTRAVKYEDIELTDKVSEFEIFTDPIEFLGFNPHHAITHSNNNKKFITDIQSKGHINMLEPTTDFIPGEKVTNESIVPVKNAVPVGENIDNQTNPTSCKCERILIVDDDSFNLLAMESLLRKYQISFTTAYHGLVAIDKILHREHNPCSISCQQFEMIFMDCNMPIMDGFETTRRLKHMMNEKQIKPIRIIGCTSYSDKNKTDECYEAGMDDIICKPISRER